MQVVILIIQHTKAGSVGLILNRPSGLRMGVGKGGLPMPIIGAPQGMQEAFADNRLYCGGLVRQDVSFSCIQGPCSVCCSSIHSSNHDVRLV